MSEKNRQHIIDEVKTLTKKIINTNSAMVVCPFHNDRNPSGGVNLDVTQARAPLGWFRCFGCKTSVPWDKYAEAAGLRPLRTLTKDTDEDYVEPNRFTEELLGDTEDGFGSLKDLEFFEFQTDEWRGIPTAFLARIGCKFCYNDKSGDFYVWMPVKIKGVLRGYVKAEMEKPDDDRPSYLNAPGSWSAQYGLIFFDYAIKLMKKKGLRTIVLCEGPRDAIRLLRAGIPAVAVLGAINWSDEKRFQLEQITGLETVIVFMDGDDAGIAATKRIVKNLKGHFLVKYVNLWKYRTPRLKKGGKQASKTTKAGKVTLLWDNELDPFSCPSKIINKLKRQLA